MQNDLSNDLDIFRIPGAIFFMLELLNLLQM